MAKLIKSTSYSDLPRAYPVELADTVASGNTAPAGCPIMSACFLVDKFDVAISDGEDGWYLKGGKSIRAGEPWANLYA